MSISSILGRNDTTDEHADAVIVMTLEGNAVQWDEGAERLFGYTSAEALGHSVFELIVLADQAQGERQLLEETVEDGASNFECVYRRKDGSMFYADSSSRILTDPESNRKFIISGKTDITKLTLARDMKQVDEKFGELLESMPDGILMTNLTGHIVLVNSQTERIFGYQRGELLGQLVEVLIPDRFRGGHAGRRTTYFVQPHVRSMRSGMELYGLRKDGTEFPVDISLSPLQPEGSTIVVSAIRDMSER